MPIATTTAFPSTIVNDTLVEYRGQTPCVSQESDKPGIAYSYTVYVGPSEEVYVTIEYHDFSGEEDPADRSYDVVINCGSDGMTALQSGFASYVAAQAHEQLGHNTH